LRSVWGHVLIEDVPGTAKTILGRALGQSIRGARFGRVRSTPDLEPADVTGVVAFDQREGGFVFRPGPIFANTLLIAGLNRAMPRTQWAVLEAIADGQVTVDGRARKLPQPFLVLATEDPTGEAPRLRGPQLDRFLMRISLGYPHPDDELEIVRGQRRGR
jgi:MoxR-like ATPase